MSDQPPLILVADDETHIVHVLSLKLRNAGYEVMTAEDGDEALELALKRPPALVITDYQMPQMTGLELCVRLREHAATRETPALLLTARGISLAGDYLDQTRIVGVLSKPFSPREVLTRVQDLVGGPALEEAISLP